LKPLIERYPTFYANSPEFKDLQAAIEPEIRALWEARDGFLAQLNVETATWGLKYWEQTLGIPVEESKDASYRRSRIQSKLRGAGITNVALIKSVAESFSNGEVEVTEYPSLFKLEIAFVGTKGIPPNMEDFTRSLRDILPAHLEWAYTYVFNTWGNVSTITWSQATELTWHELRESDFSERV